EIRLDRQTPVDPSTPFTVGVHSPLDNALGVVTTPVTAGLSRAIDESTVTTATFELRDTANTGVPSSVTYSASTRTATLTPSASLQPLTQYTARVYGGSGGVKDSGGNALSTDVTWSFTT